MKKCSVCGAEKPLSEFRRQSAQCRPCLNEKARRAMGAYRISSPRAVWGHKIKQTFGVSPEWYDEQIAYQGGVCAICLGPETSVEPKTGVTRRLAIDHNHVTGDIRSLLCAKCNLGLGALRDSSRITARATEYLKRHDEKQEVDSYAKRLVLNVLNPAMFPLTT